MYLMYVIVGKNSRIFVRHPTNGSYPQYFGGNAVINSREGMNMDCTTTKQQHPGNAVATGLTFGQALCEHFGLRRVLDVKVNDRRDEIFGATFTVALSPEDVEAVGRLMAQPR